MPDDVENSPSSPRRSTLLRFPSHSKRHASFHSPRQVPLPSPVLSHVDTPNPFFKQEPSTTPPHSPTWSPFFFDPVPSRPRSPPTPLPDDLPFSRRHRHQHSSSASSSTVHEHRPAEQSSSESDHAPVYASANRPLSVPDSQSPAYSSALSLYLHQQSPTPPVRSTTWIDRNSSASLPLPTQVPFYSLPQVQTMSREASSSTDSVSQHSGFRCPSLDGSNSSSSSSSRPSSFGRPESPVDQDSYHCSQKAPCPEGLVETAASQADSPPQRPSSPQPFRAPRPPSPDASFFSHIPEFTAMRRYMTPSQQARTLPPLEPPTILENTVSAPYTPFLSHAPAPPECRIEIETTPGAYWLHVRLPGFTREGITLATKRRRILHVVADKWENGGGGIFLFRSLHVF